MYDTEMILQIKDSLSDIYNKIVSDEQSWFEKNDKKTP
jgi:hypothetical protein